MSERLAEVRARIGAAGGDPAAITLVAVTKGFGADAVREALDAGLADFGENVLDPLLEKQREGGRWHFLGRVQRRDVRRAAGVALWQSVDRRAAAAEIAKRWPGAAVLVQVDISGEPGKLGCAPADAPQLVDDALALGLDVRGLMAVGPHGGPEAARPGFRSLAKLGADLGVRELSMGMSDDFDVAVQEGSTMVRIGRALFGPRPDPPAVRR